MQSVKETVSSIAASAKAGMDKTKATIEEQVDRMRADGPMQKELAAQKKEEKFREAEARKQEVLEHNYAVKHGAATGGFTSGEKASDYTSNAGASGYNTGNAAPNYPPGQNAAWQSSGTDYGSATHSTTGAQGEPTGMHQMSALPGHGSGEPAGRTVEGVAQSHPIGTQTGTERTSTAHNTRVGGTGAGYGTGGSYN